MLENRGRMVEVMTSLILRGLAGRCVTLKLNLRKLCWILSIVENCVDNDYILFNGIKYGEWKSSNVASMVGFVWIFIRFWKGQDSLDSKLNAVQEFMT